DEVRGGGEEEVAHHQRPSVEDRPAHVGEHAELADPRPAESAHLRHDDHGGAAAGVVDLRQDLAWQVGRLVGVAAKPGQPVRDAQEDPQPDEDEHDAAEPGDVHPRREDPAQDDQEEHGPADEQAGPAPNRTLAPRAARERPDRGHFPVVMVTVVWSLTVAPLLDVPRQPTPVRQSPPPTMPLDTRRMSTTKTPMTTKTVRMAPGFDSSAKVPSAVATEPPIVASAGGRGQRPLRWAGTLAARR